MINSLSLLCQRRNLQLLKAETPSGKMTHSSFPKATKMSFSGQLPVLITSEEQQYQICKCEHHRFKLLCKEPLFESLSWGGQSLLLKTVTTWQKGWEDVSWFHSYHRTYLCGHQLFQLSGKASEMLLRLSFPFLGQKPGILMSLCRYGEDRRPRGPKPPSCVSRAPLGQGPE